MPGFELVAGGLVLAACAGDEQPPELLDARFEDAGTIVLRFSEPLAPVEGIDPASHFRIGSAFVIDDLEGGDLTVYYDLAHHFPDGVPGNAGDAQGPWLRHGLTLVSGLELGEDPSELRLRLDVPVEPYVCDALVEAEGLGIPAAIHTHYARGEGPGIRDVAGNELADVGGWWVLDTFVAAREGSFPELEPRLAMACPDEPVPASD